MSFWGLGLRLGGRRGGGGDPYGPELITNGTFDTDLTGWTDASTPPSFYEWVTGAAEQNTNGSAFARLRQPFATEIGSDYELLVETDTTAPTNFIGSALGSSNVLGNGGGGARQFTATSTTSYFGSADSNNGRRFTKISVRKVL